MLGRLGSFIFKHRWKVILAWVIIVAACGFLAPKVADRLVPGAALPKGGEAYDGYKILDQELGIKSSSLILVFTSDSLHADSAAFMDREDEALAGLQDIPQLCDPVTFRNTGDPNLICPDGSTTYALVEVDGSDEVACKLVPVVRDNLRQQSDLDVFVTGQAALSRDMEAAGVEDMDRAAVYTFPLLAIVLILVFGSLVAAGLPLVIGGVSLAIGMGVVYFVSDIVTVNSGSLIVVAFLGLGNGVDYALIMVTRFREELRNGGSVEECLTKTCSTSGLAICGAALTTIIGLGAMISFDNSAVRAAGIGGVAVVSLAWMASLTLLPAVLAVLGARVNRLTLFNLAEDKGTFWHRLAGWQMRHPIPVLAVMLPGFLLLAWPLLSINSTNISYSCAPEESESRVGMETLVERFGAGEASPILISVTADSKITDWPEVHMLYDYTRRIAKNEHVTHVESIVDLDPSITRDQYMVMYSFPEAIPDVRIKYALEQMASEHATLVRVYTSGDPMGEEAKETVKWLRDLQTGNFQTYITGSAAYDIDLTDQLLHHFAWVLLFMMVASYVVLFWVLKSVLLPLKAVILNCLSVAATFGVVVFVFQEGHFSGLLDFTTDGTTTVTALVMIFCIVFGISMDYEVFLLSRMREEWNRTGDATESVAVGLARTGRVITSSSLVMAVTFGTFLTGNLLVIKVLGLGLALSILLDATLIRVFVVPALMRILGKWNWWAPKFAWRHPRIVKEPAHEVPSEVPVYTAVHLPIGDAAPAPSEGSPT